MKFVLELEIEDNVTRRDVALALRRTAAAIERIRGTFEIDDEAPIQAPGGDLIGNWVVS